MKTNFSTLAAAVSIALLTGCGQEKGFQAANFSGSESNSSQSTPTPGADPTSPSAFDKLNMDSYVSGTSYENEQVISIDKANKALLLFLPLPPGPFSQVYIDAPNAKGVKVTTTLDSQQKARVVVSIPLKYVVKEKITTLPSSTTLPGGRALPMMPSGEYPTLGLGLNQNSDNKVFLYLGVNAVGLFLESSYFPEYIGITAPVKNQLGTRTLGYFTIVPKAGVNKGGLFLSFLVPKDIAKIIDDHLSGIIN